MSDAVSPEKLTKEGKSAYQNGDYLAAAQAFEAAQQGISEPGRQVERRRTGEQLLGRLFAGW